MSLPPFETIVSEHGAAVLRVCRAVVGWADADDAWSETFLAALRAYSDLPSGSNVRGWLVTIAHRKAIDVHRDRARRPVPMEESDDRPVAVVATRDELLAALAQLPATQRQAVAYHHLGGLPYREVAELLGNSEAAARRAAADGIAALRRTLRSGELS